MRFEALRIKDFKKFDEKEIRFHPQFNVLIGQNGSGKTSVLEALSIAINSYVSVIEGRNVRPIRKEDIKIVSYDLHAEYKLDTSVSVLVLLGEKFGEAWTVGRPYKDWGYMRSDDKFIKALAKDYMRELSENGGKELILPLFNYLGSGRLWTESTEKVKTFPKGSRLEGYHHCLSSKGTFKRFAEWFKTMELAALQGDEVAKINAEVIRSALAKNVEKRDYIYYDVREDTLIAQRKKNGVIRKMPFSYLSDGERNIIGIVADIAYRCVLLNPYLGLNALTETPGVVLIDELDLHLHPKWQRTIVQQLKETFPRIQFITTTHSPFIVQSLKNEELYDMEGKELETDYYRKSIEEIAGQEMGVEHVERSDRFKEMESVAAQYFNLIKEGKGSAELTKVKKRLDELQELYNEDPAYVALLKAERDKANID